MAKLSRFLWITSVLLTELSVFPIAIRSFIAYYTSNRSTESFQLLFLAFIPWNWKTPSGYFAVVCAQSMWIHCGIFLKFCTLPLFAGFCRLFCAFALDIEQSLNDINMQFQNYEQQSGNSEIISALANVMQFHAIAKGLVSIWFWMDDQKIWITINFSRFAARFSDTYSIFLTVTFAIFSTLLCCALLGLNMVNSFAFKLHFETAKL